MNDGGPRILITGAAGNLGGLFARHLAPAGHRLRLMIHRTELAPDLTRAPNMEVVRADLGKPEMLTTAVDGVDIVVHFAGVLFAPHPERFLPITNAGWFSNLVGACLDARVGRIVLISFPHVEGPTTPDHPATGRLDGKPISVHARTRLEEEQLLFARTEGTSTTPVVLRLGAVYGRGILMVEAARWLACRRMLGVWREPTWFHLLSVPDFLAATTAAALKDGVHGIYHVGDERPVILQEFLDRACDTWGYARPRRMPVWMIVLAAGACEWFAALLGTRSPLTRDFVTIGRVSHVGDTSRARRDLIPTLVVPTLDDGLAMLR